MGVYRPLFVDAEEAIARKLPDRGYDHRQAWADSVARLHREYAGDAYRRRQIELIFQLQSGWWPTGPVTDAYIEGRMRSLGYEVKWSSGATLGLSDLLRDL